MEKYDPDKLELLVDSHHGIYCGQFLFDCVGHLLDITEEKREEYKNDLSDPDNEFYLDAWNDLENETIISKNGERFNILSIDGDIWAIPEDMEGPEEF